MFEYESHEHEIRRYGDGEHGDGRQLAAETEPQEEVEEHDMQEIVEEMRTAEADAVLRRGLLLEGEVGREVVVHQETEHVADGVGHVDVDPVLQDPVDGIMDGGCRGAHDAESYQFAKCFFLLHIYGFLVAKVLKKVKINE